MSQRGSWDIPGTLRLILLIPRGILDTFPPPPQVRLTPSPGTRLTNWEAPASGRRGERESIRNQQVVGSNPTVGSSRFKHLASLPPRSLESSGTPLGQF